MAETCYGEAFCDLRHNHDVPDDVIPRPAARHDPGGEFVDCADRVSSNRKMPQIVRNGAMEERLDSVVYARWRIAVRRAGFFHAGDRVGVAVSGGRDSVLLLEFMRTLGRELGLGLAVVHFNHCLRGEESEADEMFVRKRAQALGLDFLGGRARVGRAVSERKMNLEAVARAMRYRFFFSLVRQGKVDTVATAHTANDQAETVLLRLLRGAGTRGLGGIYPRLEGGVVRPFLDLTRAEVESEVSRRALAFRTDSSNLDTRFRRNRLRREIMPLLEKEFNPQVASALSCFADRARDDEAFLEEQARERSRPWMVREAGAIKIPVQRLNQFPPAIARRVLRQMVAEASIEDRRLPSASPGSYYGKTKIVSRQPVMRRVPSYSDVESARRLAQASLSGKRLPIGGTLEVRKEFEWLVVGRAPMGPPGVSRGFAHEICPPAEVAIPELELLLSFRLADNLDANLPQQGYTGGVWLDAAELRGSLTLRNFRPGDCVYRSEGERPLRVKEIFQQRRVPREQRQYWPVLESEGKIVWTRGFATATGVQGNSRPAARRYLVIEEKSASSWSSEHKH